jgi:hypothetical protein
VGIWAESGDPAILLAERLESFEDGLRIVKDGDRRIQLKRAVRAKLSVVPAPLAVPVDANHVLGEDAPESRIGEQPFPGFGGHPASSRRHGELQG